MLCPNCRSEMTAMTLDGHQGSPVSIDICSGCEAFWFDRHESLKLAPASTLKLMKLIGENSRSAKASFQQKMPCPRCSGTLSPTQDLQRNVRFNYWRCPQHGRFIRFFEFLREKNFIRPLTAQQVKELRQHVQSVNCSNCGAPVNLAVGAACTHCKSPLSMLDMKQPEEVLRQLAEASVPRPVDPALPLQLARARKDIEHSFGNFESELWWQDVSSSGLVQAGLGAVAKWLTKNMILP